MTNIEELGEPIFVEIQAKVISKSGVNG